MKNASSSDGFLKESPRPNRRKKRNDLATRNPEMAAEWHPTKNDDITPDKIPYSSPKPVWWICPEGHEYKLSLRRRVKNPRCPVCTNTRHLGARKTLAKGFPEIAAEWHPTKNGDITPETIYAKSCNRVWWICKNGHEFQLTVRTRTTLGRGCPIERKEATPGINDLQTLYPEIAEKWHPTLNKDVSLSTIGPKSDYLAYWNCGNGHTFLRKVKNMVKSTQCPHCPKSKALSIEQKYPEIAPYWHPTKNGDLTPKSVILLSRPVWWICERGHELQALAAIYSQKGCPLCKSNLELHYPKLAAEWHPTKNGEIKPIDVSITDMRAVWWKCPEGHDWRASPYRRVRHEKCPYCLGKKPIPGTNDLATTHPWLVKEWHPRNTISPSDVFPTSHMIVRWIDENGHEWDETVRSRASRPMNR